MSEITFVPAYFGFTRSSGVAGKLILGIFGIITGLTKKNLLWFIFGLFLVLWGIYEWISCPIAIIFASQEIIVKRNYSLDRSFAHHELNILNIWGIRFGNHYFPFGDMKNLQEFKILLGSLLNNGVIKPEQVGAESEFNLKSTFYTVASAIAFGIVFVYLLVFQN